MSLSSAQIALYAAAAGWTGNDLVTAVAIALAESSGNPQAYNPETAAGAAPGQGSYGLWQIYLTMHPEDASLNLYDPQQNADAAFAIYAQAGGFSPWTGTYGTGAYLAYLSQAQQGVLAVENVSASPPTAAPVTPFTALTPAANAGAALPTILGTIAIALVGLWAVEEFA